MKRDMNLIRELLFQLESDQGGKVRRLQAPEGCSPEQVNYHATLMLQAGLIEGKRTVAFSGVTFRDLSLTWTGHEFLDAIRPPLVWERVQERLAHLGGATLAVVKDLAIDELKKILGGSHG